MLFFGGFVDMKDEYYSPKTEEKREHCGFVSLFWYNDKKSKLITVKENLKT